MGTITYELHTAQHATAAVVEVCMRVQTNSDLRNYAQIVYLRAVIM